MVISIILRKFAKVKFIIVNTIMDIVSRLKLFLQQNGIANSQFADTCEIPRPTLSQLLNGRNKKVSDEIITKIHRAYPSLNIMWLMFGDGNMLAGDQETQLSFFDNSGSSPSTDLSQNAAVVQNGSQSKSQQSIVFGEGDAVTSDAPSAPAPTPLTAALQSLVNNVGKKNTGAVQQNGARKVVSIMVFYNDNSFENFLPAT